MHFKPEWLFVVIFPVMINLCRGINHETLYTTDFLVHIT